MSALHLSGNICSATFNAECLLPTRTSPETAARCSLEGAGDIRGDPPTIKISGLRRHAFVIDKAAVKRPRVKSNVIEQGSEGWVRIGVAPGHIAQRFAVHDDIEVDCFALPLAARRRRDGRRTNGAISSGGK